MVIMAIDTIAVICYELQTRGHLLYRNHFAARILESERPSDFEVEFMLCEDNPQVIYRYPLETEHTSRSLLIWSIMENGRVGHVVCSCPPNCWLITTYWPDTEPDEWSSDYKCRIQRTT